GHLVANRERRVPGQPPASAAADEARELRSRGPWHLPHHPRRGGKARSEGEHKGRQHLYPQSLAGHLPDDLRRARTFRIDLLPEVQQEQEQQGLARLAVLRGRWGVAGRGWLLQDPRTRRRRD